MPRVASRKLTSRPDRRAANSPGSRVACAVSGQELLPPPRRGRSGSFFSRGSWPGRGGRGAVPGAMSGRRSSGPRARAASTASANALAVAAGTLPIQAALIWRTRSPSWVRRSRSRFECFVTATSFHQTGWHVFKRSVPRGSARPGSNRRRAPDRRALPLLAPNVALGSTGIGHRGIGTLHELAQVGRELDPLTAGRAGDGAVTPGRPKQDGNRVAERTGLRRDDATVVKDGIGHRFSVRGAESVPPNEPRPAGRHSR